MPSHDKEYSRSRRGRQVEDVAPATGPRPFGAPPLKYVGVGLLAVMLICSWQFVLISGRIEPSAEPRAGSVSDALWAHESNITALASEQRQLVGLAVRLGEQLKEQQKEILALRARLDAGARGAGGGGAAAAAASGAGAAGGGDAAQAAAQAEAIGQQEQRIAELQNSIKALNLQVGSQREAILQGMQHQAMLRGAASGAGPPAADASAAAPPPLPSPPPAAAESSKGSDLPPEWLQRFSREELERSAQEADVWRRGVREAFQHVWRGYRERAWGKDEFKPVTGTEGRKWGGLGLMILDSLSTMWVMGLTTEFDEATNWVETSLRFDKPGYVSFFETTIRALGGLISAHSLSGREVFLNKARELADRMMPAFAQGDPGFPESQVDLRTGAGKRGWFGGAVLAEAGTVQLEFRYLSQHSDNPSYAERADRSMRSLVHAGGGRALLPWGITKNAPARPANNHITFGAMGDSYYEYLLKMYVQTGLTESEWKDAWKRAMSEMQARLVKRTITGLTYVSEEINGNPSNKMDHLACFVGGMLIYGSRSLPESERDPAWEQNAAAITETCYQMYHRMPSHLAPEAMRFNPHSPQPGDMEIFGNDCQYLLRPEAAESIFYMFYYTGDPKYRRMAGEIFMAIEKHARTNHGYSAVMDVRQARPALKNELETFFLAETLKYLYLTFVPNPREVVNLDEFVFNTEAHPIRIFRQ